MFRLRSKQLALETASELDLAMGFCVFDGLWYVGTVRQLKNIGCLYIENIKEEELPVDKRGI